MKTLNSWLAFILTFSIAFSQEHKSSEIQKTEGFSHPESVVIDEDNKILYISNIGNKEPGDGFISRVNLDGKIEELKWIEGLDDPKGLLILDGKLWVTDNTDLVAMDIESGEVTKRVAVKEAAFLNDISADEGGNLYISDTGKSSIFKRNSNGEITEWLSSQNLESPNGLLVVGDKIYVAAWGVNGDGNLLEVDLDSKEITPITKKGIGNLDGIQLIDNEQFYISDWATGNIYEVGQEGEPKKILTSAKSAGDILFLDEANQIVVPMNHQNAVWWYQLEK